MKILVVEGSRSTARLDLASPRSVLGLPLSGKWAYILKKPDAWLVAALRVATSTL